MWAKAVALRGLPGPKYNVIVGQLKELSKSDPHRWAKEVADEYGPIVKCRVMFFFVRPFHQDLAVVFLIVKNDNFHSVTSSAGLLSIVYRQ